MGRPAGARPVALPAGATGGRPAVATLAAAARGSTKREDKDSLTIASRAAFRRLGCRREDKDSTTFLVFPRSTTRPAGGMWRIGKIRNGPFLILPIRTTPPRGPRGSGGRGERGAPCPPSRGRRSGG